MFVKTGHFGMLTLFSLKKAKSLYVCLTLSCKNLLKKGV